MFRLDANSIKNITDKFLSVDMFVGIVFGAIIYFAISSIYETNRLKTFKIYDDVYVGHYIRVDTLSSQITLNDIKKYQNWIKKQSGLEDISEIEADLHYIIPNGLEFRDSPYGELIRYSKIKDFPFEQLQVTSKQFKENHRYQIEQIHNFFNKNSSESCVDVRYGAVVID